MDDTLAIILKDTYSLTQLKHRLRILKVNLEKNFFGGTEENFTAADLNWLEFLPENFSQRFDKNNIYEIFANLDKTSAQLPILTIYLTFEYNDVTAAQIGSYARTAFNQPLLLLDIKFDPLLAGGTALVWKGVYKDYSLRKMIEDRKSEILQSFKRFLR